jgi:hypothetical protein
MIQNKGTVKARVNPRAMVGLRSVRRQPYGGRYLNAE